jgi:hypothetical protein
MATDQRRFSVFGKKPPKKKENAPIIDPTVSIEVAKIDQLSDVDVNDKVLQMLEDINITSEVGRQHILGQTVEEKKRLLKNWILRDHHSRANRAGPTNPDEYVDELKQLNFEHDQISEHQHQVVDKLRVSLSTNGLGWVKKFGEHKGLDVLLDIIRKCVNNTFTTNNTLLRRIQHQCVRSIKAFMNNKYGLTTMLQKEDGLIVFVSAMDPYNEGMMTDVLRVVGAVCLVADGHDRVLEAVTVNGENCGINRFDPVLQAIKTTKNPVFQCSCMQFINAIVTTPEELEFRVHLRNEFMRGGLGEVLAQLREINVQDLTLHLDIFDEHRENDFEEIQQKLKAIQFEFNDPDEVYKMINSITLNSLAAKHFLSILQHLLLIRDDFWARPQYFKLIDKCISQIVLHHGGIDPDFHYTQKFNMDIDAIIEGFVDKARLEDAEINAKDLERLVPH